MTSFEEQIKQEVVDRIIANAEINARDIGVHVRGGYVTLQGSVAEDRARAIAASEAMQVGGVTKVDNQLEVCPAPPPRAARVADTGRRASDIENQVEAALRELTSVSVDNVAIQAVDGLVSVKGCVDALWKKARVGDVIRSIDGVADVDNKLTVVPTHSRLDQDIALDIEAALDRHPMTSAETITVTVEHGVVTLSANLSNGSIKQNALKVVLDTAGVVEIKDEIAVRQDIGRNPLEMP